MEEAQALSAAIERNVEHDREAPCPKDCPHALIATSLTQNRLFFAYWSREQLVAQEWRRDNRAGRRHDQ
jgi:hypothetical protein